MLVEQEEEILSHVAKVVRALITSAKPPVELRAILKDYVAIEGEQLPFRQLGYSNPQELLQDTEEFNFNGHGNQVNVMAQSIEMSRLSLSQLLHTFISAAAPPLLTSPFVSVSLPSSIFVLSIGAHSCYANFVH